MVMYLYAAHIPIQFKVAKSYFFDRSEIGCQLVKVLLAATITPKLISPIQLMHAYEGGTEGQTTKLRTCYCFVNDEWVLQCPRVLFTNKSCEMGHMAYSPYPRRLESLTIC